MMESVSPYTTVNPAFSAVFSVLKRMKRPVFVTVDAIAVARKRLFSKPRQPYIEFARIFSASCLMFSWLLRRASDSDFMSAFTSRRFCTK